MIAFKESHPLVQFTNGHTIRFDRDWLEASVIAAAAAAGYEQWWLAEHVTESVTLFLERDFQGDLISIDALNESVDSTLQVIGYNDIAHYYQPLPPPAVISLEQIARNAGSGYELAFFRLLRAELRGLLDLNAQQITIEGLHLCVKYLRHAKHWRNDCIGLRDEIVNFIRSEIALAITPTRMLSLRLS